MSTQLKRFSRRLSASQRALMRAAIQPQLQARLTAVAHPPGVFMSSTIITGKAAAAFRNAKTGEVIYLLFQQSYEPNCHPHFERWTCKMIGNATEALQYVFMMAAYCEGGSYQVKSGMTKPETFIKSWRISLSEPFRMDDLEIELRLGGTSMDDPIPDTQVEASIAALERIGRGDLVEALKVGPVKVSLHGDSDILTALYGVGTNLPLWKVIDGLKGLGYADASLALPLAKRDIKAPRAQVYAVDNHNFVGSIDGGPLKHLGWRDTAVGTYIRDVVCPIELQSSFSCYRLIREFRDACNEAPELPDETAITVTPANAEHSYYVDNAKKLAVKLGLYADADAVPESYETTLGIVRELKEEYLLSALEDQQVQWAIAPSVDVSTLHGMAASGGQVLQQSLF
jgi:hypothetical protein